jgi:hypothetical protein
MGCNLASKRRTRVSGGLVSACIALLLFASPSTAEQSPGLGQAKAALLVKSDFPSGWSAQGSVTTSNGGGETSFPGGGQALQQLATCLGINPALVRANPPSATSPTFEAKGGTLTVQDDANVFSSANLARQEEVVFASPKTPGCMASVMQNPATQQQVFGKGYTAGTLSVTAPSSSWRVPHSGGFAMSVPLTHQGETLDVSVTIIAMVRGKIGSVVSFSSVGSHPFSAPLARHLLATAYART